MELEADLLQEDFADPEVCACPERRLCVCLPSVLALTFRPPLTRTSAYRCISCLSV